MHNLAPTHYFGGVEKASRGPWFRHYWVEEDGLEWYYTYQDTQGKVWHLLSNSVPLEDREKMSHLYHDMNRNNKVSWFLGFALGAETIRWYP